MNNFWHTNFCAAQGGEFTFRFSITVADDVDNAAAARHASRFTPDVQAAVDELVRIESPHARLLSFKPAEDFDGYILRLQELNGRDGEVTITLGCFAKGGIGSAVRATGIEHPHPQAHAHPVIIDGHQLRTHLHPYEIRTLRIRPPAAQRPAHLENRGRLTHPRPSFTIK
jgi:hypothetical protein